MVGSCEERGEGETRDRTTKGAIGWPISASPRTDRLAISSLVTVPPKVELISNKYDGLST